MAIGCRICDRVVLKPWAYLLYTLEYLLCQHLGLQRNTPACVTRLGRCVLLMKIDDHDVLAPDKRATHRLTIEVDELQLMVIVHRLADVQAEV